MVDSSIESELTVLSLCSSLVFTLLGVATVLATSLLTALAISGDETTSLLVSACATPSERPVIATKETTAAVTHFLPLLYSLKCFFI